MCGIFCIFSTSADYTTLSRNCKLCQNYIKGRGPNHYSYHELNTFGHNFIVCASILWLQGEDLVKQPIINENSIFLYNGDVFGGDISAKDRGVLGDTVMFLEKLEQSENIPNTLTGMQGPYAFIYIDKANSKLYFGRDIFGRRSLLIGKIEDGLLLTSVAMKDVDCVELPAIGTFSYDLNLKALTLTPWSIMNQNFSTQLKELESFLQRAINIDEDLMKSCATGFIEPQKDDVEIFEKVKSLQIHEALQVVLRDTIFLNNIKTLCNLLEDAVSRRISTQPRYCKNCIHHRNVCDHALTAVLFSGGLDCTILALLADKFTDKQRSIDLINVAFEKGVDYNTPDRITGLESLEELRRLCPDRMWNFVPVNVPVIELNEERKRHIRHLIHPLNSILDDSLGCALWFASRGRCEAYETTSRILLVGMGADELFGGYTRHRAALTKRGWSGLSEALNEDWQNLPHRNLARDDRVVSDHGRQLRTPYLDENVVAFVRNLPCWQKTCPSKEIPAGLGDKILLRGVAYYFGLRKASTFKKRALQFGSRIANSKENSHDVSPRL